MLSLLSFRSLLYRIMASCSVVITLQVNSIIRQGSILHNLSCTWLWCHHQCYRTRLIKKNWCPADCLRAHFAERLGSYEMVQFDARSILENFKELRLKRFACHGRKLVCSKWRQSWFTDWFVDKMKLEPKYCWIDSSCLVTSTRCPIFPHRDPKLVRHVPSIAENGCKRVWAPLAWLCRAILR